MRRHAIFLVAVVAGSAAVAASLSADGLLKKLHTVRSDVSWDRNSAVVQDFDGDGGDDVAALGYVRDGVVLAIVTSSTKGEIPQILTFGVNGRDQAAICGPLPARLETYPLSCDADGAMLSGCIESPSTSGLTLSGGDCDSVHLYWNHDEKRMSWWRR